MNSNFATALAKVLAHEGGFVNHKLDPGGATNLGITIGTAKRYGVDMDGDGDTDIIDIKNLTAAAAAKIYKGEYWAKVNGDLLPSGLDYAVFDFAVNSGVSRAAKYLQAILGVTQDGAIGPATLKALEGKNVADLINMLCDKRLAFLKGLSTWSTFGKGWSSRVSGVRSSALAMSKAKASALPPVIDAPPAPNAKPNSDTAKPNSVFSALFGFLATLLKGGRA